MNGSFVRIYRPRSFRRDIFRAYRLEIDGRPVGSVRNGAETLVPVPAGEHDLRALIDWSGSKPLRVSVASGETVTVRVNATRTSATQAMQTTDGWLELTRED